LRSILRSILRPVELTFTVRDGVLLLTTFAVASETFSTVVYPVGDLSNRHHPLVGGDDYQSLKKTIVGTIAPTTWDEVGGNGKVILVPQTRSLVVSQTEEVQEQIAGLLAALRVARDAQKPAPGVTVFGMLVN
jgi:hypothetical protein